ncbi:MAG: ComEA family DNA-binding protein [Cyclobacteriaceae bacterium]
MIKKLLLIIVGVIAGLVHAMAQNNIAEFNLESHIEEFFGFQDQDVDYEELYESFMNNFLHPINLNTADADDFRSLMILSEIQINNLLQYREDYGSFVTVRELYAVPTIDEKTINAITPFIQVSAVEYEFHNKGLGRNELLLRYASILENKKGYQLPSDSSLSRPYAGDPGRLYTRLHSYKPGSYSLSLLAEKDPGERLNWDKSQKQFGFDFYSFNLTLENKGNFKKIVVGDYQIEAGEQLILGSGLFFGKGAESINTVKRSSRGIRPYRSVLEHSFFRGLALTYEIPDINLQITPFYSRRDHSASSEMIMQDSVENIGITNLRTSGLHRTESEISGRQMLAENTYGTNIDFQTNKLNVGGSFIYSMFDHPFLPRNQPYRRFAFQGEENYNASIYFNYLYKNMYFFAESALSQSMGMATVGGLITRINDQWQSSLVYRKYDRNFHSFYGTGFSESGNSNEEGFYWGLKWKYSSKLEATAFVDIFRFPWLRYRADAPSSGIESLIRINYYINPSFKFFTQYRYKSRGLNSNTTENLSQLAQDQRDSYILHFDMSPEQYINLKSRISWSNYRFNSQTSGVAFAQDANLYWNRLKLYSRLVIFNTDDFNNRQYFYENDLLYAFSIPALFGRGLRYYLMARIDLTENITFWTKFSRTRFTDRNVLGTGNEEIMGNRRSELRFQLRYTF